MNVKTIKVGFLETNCYIIEECNKCLVIDPGDEADKILKNIKYKVVGILVTHHHFDHIGALNSFDKNLILDKSNRVSSPLWCVRTMRQPVHRLCRIR